MRSKLKRPVRWAVMIDGLLFCGPSPAGVPSANAPAFGQASPDRSARTTTQPTFVAHPVLTGSVSAAALVLSRADVALARSVISPSLLNGELSERLVNQALLRQFQSSGDWEMIRPRMGSQGFDGVLVKMDRQGTPRQVFIAETKYNTARLGMTRDGVQMGRRWRGTRLRALASRYELIATEMAAERVSVASAPGGLSPHSQLDIPLGHGRVARAWREGEGPWAVDLSAASASDVRSQASRLARLLNAASAGRVTYRSRIFQVVPEGHDVLVTARDAAALELGAQRLSQLPVTGEFRLSWSGPERREVTASMLLRKLPNLTDSDAAALAAAVSAGRGEPGGMAGLSAHVATTSLAAGLVAAGLDPALTIASQWLTSGRVQVDLGQLSRSAVLSFGSTAVGVASGEGILVLVTQNRILSQFAGGATHALGLPTSSLLTGAASGVFGISVASTADALVLYELGWMDAQTARREAAGGIIAGTTSTLVVTGGFWLIATYGTASTGVAISSLSGAAASSASLAWLGGGSVAAGGGGMALGSVIATGGAVVIVVAVGAGVEYAFHYYDERKETQRVLLTVQELESRPDLSESRFGPQPR